MENIYADIARRTAGNIYIGVVGPVRTGKSTLIKRIMEQLVIPNIEDPYQKERARDELPQSGSGRTIMTSEPKFIPEEAAEISPQDHITFRIRMIDSVGYMVDGAVGAHEDGAPRMVTTPWFDYEIPMTEAAELGTQKVMQEHCSIGLVVTTDGTITDIPRKDYAAAECRAIRDMQATGKPFLVIINSSDPKGEAALQLKESLTKEFAVYPMVADCQSLDETGIQEMLQQLLYAFPLQELHIHMPRWMDALDRKDPIKSTLYEGLLEAAEHISILGQAQFLPQTLHGLAQIQDVAIENIDLSTGTVSCRLRFPEVLYYDILSAKTGMVIENDAMLLSILTELSQVKQEYDRIADALHAVKTTGYGIVMPNAEEMQLEKPQIMRKGSAYGVKLKAGAPSIHMIRVDIDTEINPMVGDEKQSQDLITYLSAETPQTLWQSNIFGKSVEELVREGLAAKLIQTPADVRDKFRASLCRIVNEGATGLICLIL